jgi:hypothetical protein
MEKRRLPEEDEKETASSFHLYVLLSDNVPDIKRRGQREDQAREQDAGSRELKLSVLPVVKVRRTYLYEKENRQDHVDHREDNLVRDVLDLCLRCIPCRFYGSGHIAITISKARDGHEPDYQHDHKDREDNLSGLTRLNKLRHKFHLPS